MDLFVNPISLHSRLNAEIAQLVEHQLPKLRVAGSIPVFRSSKVAASEGCGDCFLFREVPPNNSLLRQRIIIFVLLFAGFMTKNGNILTRRYNSPCGDLLLGSLGDRLCLCNWVEEKHPGRVSGRLQAFFGCSFEEAFSDVTQEAARQLDEYFRKERKTFDIPLLFAGTEFQVKVWKGLLEIPYGQTVSYSGLASSLGVPRAVRAVANANAANAISIFAPCHRVIGSGGTLAGYGGGVEAKRFLLELENVAVL